ncbi:MULTISPECIES: TraB/GumN family protein [Flavobacterium]|uniref:TraB/GumN family protein n=1 Tax=Flavobacterium jumunjinense TaxID=998845 RepID=A0ABV5GSY5_9FLAO|nr:MULTISPECIES: TraB/GumN family protein [Flavobacterium]
MVRFIIEVAKFAIVTTMLIIGLVANAQKLDNSLLWKISGNGLEKPSYLYGTMHAVCETNIDDKVMKAFDETNQLYLEVDMDDPNLQASMMGGLMMKDGVTITSLITEEEAKKLDAFLQKNIGFSLKMINTFKPFSISSMYIPKLLDCPMKAVDTELMNISVAQNEEVFGLETIEDQMAVFDKIPYDVQIEELLKSAETDLKKDKEEMKKMLTIYKSEDIEAMLAFTKESENKLASDFEEELLINRNQNWIPIISKVAKEKPTFFGVGVGHLAGDKGVIKLLRKKGFKVEAVK